MRRMISFTPVAHGEFDPEQGLYVLDKPIDVEGLYMLIIDNSQNNDNNSIAFIFRNGVSTPINYSPDDDVYQNISTLGFDDSTHISYANYEPSEGSIIEVIRIA